MRIVKVFAQLSLIILGITCFPKNGFAEISSSAEGLPKVVVPESKFDYGKVVAGTKVEHDFLLKNVGTAPLKIEQVHTSCGCTAAVLDSATIAPGGETKVRTTFDTTGFEGKKIKTIRLYSNDPQNSSFLFSLEGTVRSEVIIEPTRVFFGDVVKGSGKTIFANILVLRGAAKTTEDSEQATTSASEKRSKEIQITEATSKSPFLDVSLESAETQQSDQFVSKRLKVTLKENTPVGPFRERIVVRTTSGVVPVINVGVFARVQGDLLLNPNSVSFGLLEPANVRDNVQIVKVENSAAKAVSITSVETDNPGVVPVLVPQPGKNSSEIHISVKPELMGAFRAIISVYTDNQDPDQKKLTIPVYGIVARKGS